MKRMGLVWLACSLVVWTGAGCGGYADLQNDAVEDDPDERISDSPVPSMRCQDGTCLGPDEADPGRDPECIHDAECESAEYPPGSIICEFGVCFPLTGECVQGLCGTPWELSGSECVFDADCQT